MNIQKSESIGALATSLSLAQGEIEAAKKDSDNPFFKSKYADLASVWDACREPLSKNKLAIIQLPGKDADGYFVDTVMTHASGEYVASRLVIKPVKDDPQGLGSAITYARRYGLQAIVGIAPEEDDGEESMGRNERKASKIATPKPEPEPAKQLTDDERKAGNIAKLRKFIGDHCTADTLPDYETHFCQKAATLCTDPHDRAKLEDFTLEELRELVKKAKIVMALVTDAIAGVAKP